MLAKFLKSKKGEAHIDVVIGIFVVVITIVIALNVFTFVTMKTHMDRIADTLIETATYSGGFGERFYEQVEKLQDKYFDFDVEVNAENWYNLEYQRVQLGDTMSITVRAHSSLSGINIVIPMNLSVYRTGQSEQYWHLDDPGYDNPDFDSTEVVRYALDNNTMTFHELTCGKLQSVPSGHLSYTSMPSTDCIMFGFKACTTCSPHVCTPENGIESFNKQYHWGVCACGEVAGVEEHFWVYQESNNTYYCSGCLAVKRNDSVYCRKCTEKVISNTHANTCSGIDESILQSRGPGLYKAGTTTPISNWDSLLSAGYLTITDRTLTCNAPSQMAGDLVLPNDGSIMVIADNAFKNCAGLTSIKFPDNVGLDIGKSAFEGCSSLTSLTMPSSLSDVGERAFAGCTKLLSVTIQKFHSIGSYAFADCTSLQSVDMVGHGTVINPYTFSGCSNLTSVKFNGYGWKIDNAIAPTSNPENNAKMLTDTHVSKQWICYDLPIM